MEIESTRQMMMVFGGSGVGILGMALWLLRRTGKKIIEHVDNPEIHVNSNNGYVTKEMCGYKHKDYKDDINRIHDRIDKANQQQVELLEKILNK